MADYRIDLGVGLNQSQLNQTKQILESIENQQRKVEYDVDFNIKNIDKLKTVSKEFDKIKDQLNGLGSKGKSKNIIPIDTDSVEKSLGDIHSSIKKLQNAFGKVDSKKGVQSLLTTVNKISTSLEKVSKQFVDLNKNLTNLSTKEFGLNFDLGLGKSGKNPEQAIKELKMLQKEMEEYQNYFAKFYSGKINKNTLSVSDADPISRLIGQYNPRSQIYANQLLMKMGKGSDAQQIAVYKEYLSLIKETAAIAKIPLEPVEFRLAESGEFVKVRNEANETEKKLKELFSGGIDAENLQRTLSEIADDLNKIKQSLIGVDSEADSSINKLVQSFNRLSESVEKFVQNATLVKNVLGDSLGTSTPVDTSAINKIEKASDDATAAVVQNEKKKQEAYKATTDTVLYHAGVVSKLNKAETNGRFYGSNRGTGYFGTGHYFVDSATKHELDNNGYYSKMPYTSVDISQYDNLFKATTDEVADRLHTFLANLTSFTQGSDNYDVSELFAQFKSVFGDTIMDVKEFGSRLDQLKAFMSNSSLDDRSDSVSTQFMKSLGYGGVDTRGTRFADTRYGTVIYDLKEESILQANITDELQKQGQMLEKINYAKGQAFDKDTDARIQNELDAQAKKREIANEFKNSFDTSGFDKADADLTAAQNRLREIDEIIQSCQYSINNADQEAKKFARDMEDIGLGYTNDEVEDYKRRFTESYQSTINELSQEKAELQSKIPVLEEVYNKEQQLANEAYKQAEQTVEQRHQEAQQAQETANAVVQGEEKKQQAYRETADEAKKAANSSLSKEADKITKKLSGSDLGASKYDNEIDNVTTKFNKLSNQSDQLKSDIQSLNTAFSDIKAANAANDVEALVNANRKYEQILTRVKNQIDINSRAEKETSAIAKKEASEKAKAEKEAAAIANKMQKEADAAALKQTNEELKKLETTARKIGQLDFKIVKSDYNDEIELVREFERQLELLKTQYNETAKTLSSKGIDIGSITTPEFIEARNKIAEFDAQIETTKRKLAEKLQLKLDSGDFSLKVSKIESDAKNLSGTYEDIESGIKEVNAALKMMQTASTDGDIERLIDANNRYEAALKKVENQLKQNKIAEQDAKRAANIEQQKLALEQKSRNLSLDMDNWLKDNSAAAKQFGSAIKELQMRLESCDNVEFNNIKGEFQQIQKEAKALGLTTKTVGDRIKQQFAQYSTYLSVAEVFMYAEQGLRSMFEQVKLIDSAMTELKKVTDETDASYNKFLSNAASRSKELGTTIDGLVSSTADFARLGYGFEDAQGLAEVANIYAVVGDEIEGVEGATESLVSTLAAFKDELSGVSDTDFAMDIIDKFNEVSNNFSISSGGIGEAMQRSASSLRAANNTIDESIALITAANSVVQDPTVVGTAFKTISMRIRGAKTELEEAGLETEGMVESTATLRAEIDALTGVDIMKNENEFKSTYQIMDELAAKWKDLSDIQQATVTELIAGKRQGNIVSSLMTNFDTARKALDTSLSSSGSAMREHAKWSESLEARLNKLKSTWQSLSQTFMSSDFLKSVLDGVIGLVNGLDKLIDAIGAFPALAGLFAAFESFKGVGLFQTVENEASLTGKRVTNIFAETARQTQRAFKDISLKTDSSFKASIDTDIDALNRLKETLRFTGSVDENTFNKIFENASVAARKFAKDSDLSAKSIDGFIKAQKESQVATLAQNKSLGNARAIIKEYFGGCKNVEMSQESFANAVGKTNPKLAQQLTVTKTARGAFAGYTASLIGAKVAAIGLEIAATALNAAITMGVSFLISGAISLIQKWINAKEDLAEKVDEVTSKFKEQHTELVKNKSSFESQAKRYSQLAKGVNNLGENVSLTADEYAEYQDIVNSIADQVPSLVQGYDAQGNAILNYKGNVEELTTAYEELIKKQNESVLKGDAYKDIEKDFKNAMEDAKSADGGFMKTKASLNEINALEALLKSNNVDELIPKINEKYGANFNYLINELENAGVEKMKVGESAYDFVERAVTQNKDIVQRVVNDFNANLDAEAEGMRTAAQAALSKAFDFSDSAYKSINDKTQSLIRQIVGNFDAEQFDKIVQSGKTVEEYINDMLDSFKNMSKGEAAELETAFDLQTKFNGGDISYGEYIQGIKNAEEVIDGLNIDDEVKNQIKLTLNTDEVTDNYEALKKRLTEKYELNMETEKAEKKAEKFLNGLSVSEYQVAIDLIDDEDVNFDDFDSIKELRKYIKEQAKLTEAMNYTIAMDIEIENLDALNTALSESVSGAGLSSEAIAALKARYAELEGEGYNLSAMFEETANGIHLNKEAVSELEQKLASDKLSETDKQLEVLKGRYDELTTEIDNCTDASDRAALYTEQQSIVDKINDLATLASQYGGLTSAYNAWIAAEEAGSERDMYEGIIEGFETVKDEISRGWIDDGTIKFLELLTGKTGLAGKSGKELKKIYDSLDDKIGKSKYSISDFFTVNDDGESTNTGVYNFLETVETFEDKLGNVIKKKDGNIIGFDFEVAGGDEVIAETLGISEELVQIMLRAADDAGFVVNLEGAYTQLADLKTEAESARDTLISLQKNGLAKLKGVDVNFDLDAEGNDLVAEQEKAVKLLNKFRKKGKIDLKMEGAQQALDIAEYLTIKLDDLTEPKIMQIDVSEVDEDLRDPIEKMQEIVNLSKEKNLVSLTGDKKEIEETQGEINKVAEELESLDPEIKAKVGIDEDWDAKTIASKVEKGEIEIPAELELDVQMSDDLKDMRLMMMNQLGLADDNEVKLKVGYDIDESLVDTLDDKKQKIVLEYITENEEEFNKLTDEEKEVVVKLIADGVDLDNYVAEDKEAIVNYIANGEEADGWTPEAKDAFVKYLADGGEIDKFDPKNKESWVVYETDTTKPDGYEPDDEDATVTYDKDSSVPDGYDPKDPDATVTYNKDTTDIDSYNPPNFIRSVVYKIKTAVSNAASKGAKVLKDRFGIGEVDGTANADGTAFAKGTTGRAFKQGYWGTKDSGEALGGELGVETLVRNGRFYTIGNNGAEFFKYKKGDIIFNHKQTEELFKNGKVTSGNGRGKAFAGGSAGFGGFTKVKAVSITDTGTGNNSKSKSKTTTKLEVEADTSGSNSEKTGTDKVEGKSVLDKLDEDEDKDKDKFEETFDWVEVAISRIEREIDNLDQKANRTYKSWSSRNTALTKEIGEVRDEIDLQEKAYNRYLKEANNVGLSSSWKKKVQNGEVDIKTIKDEALAEKIKSYQDFYEKALQCKDAIEDLKDTEAELYKQRFDNIQAQYDGILQGYEHTETMLNEYIAQAEAQGHIVSKKYYQSLISNEESNISQLKKEQADLIAARDEWVANGGSKNSQDWYDMCAEIDAVTQAIEEGTTSLIEYDNAMRQIDWDVFDLKMQGISDVNDEADFLIDLMSNDDLYDDKGKLTGQGAATLGLHGQKHNTYMYAADEYGKEISNIDAKIASGEYDANDQEVINRRRELIGLQRESILAAEDEKEAIKDLVQEGIDKELDALQEVIDKKNESLEAEKD